MSIPWINKYLKTWETVLLALGILLIGVSINHKPITAYVTDSISISRRHILGAVGDGIGPPDKNIHGKITLSGQTSLDVPSTVYVDEPFWIELDIDIDGASKEEAISRVYNTQLRLTGSGLDFEPKDWQGPLIFNNPTHGEVMWSLKPSSAGHFPVILSSKAIDPKIAFIPVSHSEQFVVRRRFWRFLKDTWPIFSGFGGTFLTLPGIFSFVTQWRKDRQEKKDKMSQRSAPKIRPGYAGEIENKDASTQKKPSKSDNRKDRYH